MSSPHSNTDTTETILKAGETADTPRRTVYQLLSDPDQSPEEKIHNLLAVARDYLDLENAHIAHIDEAGEHHEIVYASGTNLIQVGDSADLTDTYYQPTIESEDILAIPDTDAPTAGSHSPDPGLKTYLGCKLRTGDGLYGTLSVVGSQPRESGFSQSDQEFLTFLGRVIEGLLEHAEATQTRPRAQEIHETFIQEVSDYAIFTLDTSGHVTTWNEGARMLKGYDEADILGEHFSIFYPEAKRETGRPARLLEIARQEGRVQDEGWRLRKDGSKFWACVSITAVHDDEGDLVGFTKVTHNLTERREVTQALADEQEFTDRALNALSDVFFVLESDGTLSRANESVCAVTGYSKDKVLSMTAMEFFTPADRATIREAIQDCVATGSATVEATLLTKDNLRRQYEFRAKRLSDTDSDATWIVGIGRDITERNLSEERLTVALRVLRHNLRNSVNVISGYAEALQEQVLDEDQRAAAEKIANTANQLGDLSEKTRSIATINEGARGGTPVDVIERTTDIVQESRQVYPAAAIDVEVPCETDEQLIVPDRFEAALESAIENAIEHNPDSQPWVGVSLKRLTGSVAIRIQDTGPGIPESELEVLRKGETQLEHGSGLGLWMIYWNMKVIGGDVSVEARNPTGTTVILTVPVLR